MLSIIHIILSLVIGEFKFILLTENCGGPFIELFLKKWQDLDILHTIFGFAAITVFTICNFCVNFILQVFIKELANKNRKSLEKQFLQNTLLALILKSIYNLVCFILSMLGVWILQKDTVWPYVRIGVLFLLELSIDTEMLRLYKNVIHYITNISSL